VLIKNIMNSDLQRLNWKIKQLEKNNTLLRKQVAKLKHKLAKHLDTDTSNDRL